MPTNVTAPPATLGPGTQRLLAAMEARLSVPAGSDEIYGAAAVVCGVIRAALKNREATDNDCAVLASLIEDE
jgi:hypothetical protein